MKLSRNLSEEQQRDIRENMTEEELGQFSVTRARGAKARRSGMTNDEF